MAKPSSSPKRPKVQPLIKMSAAELQRVRGWHATGFQATFETYKEHIFRAWLQLQAATDLAPLMAMHLTAMNAHNKKGGKKCK